MHEDKIFGPLTLAQFMYTAIGCVISYFLLTNFSSNIHIPAIIIVAGIVLTLIHNSPHIVIDEQYIQIKKATSKTPQDFENWVRSKLAMIESQIIMVKERGLTEDPKLLELKTLLEKYMI